MITRQRSMQFLGQSNASVSLYAFAITFGGRFHVGGCPVTNLSRSLDASLHC
jgi:hypothetical protein